MATLAAPIQLPGIDYKNPDFRQGSRAHDQAFQALEAQSAALPEGKVVGALISFPFADGYAIYQVKSAKPLKIAPVLYGDSWQVPYATIRGLRLQDVEAMVRRDRGVRALFGQKKT